MPHAHAHTHKPESKENRGSCWLGHHAVFFPTWFGLALKSLQLWRGWLGAATSSIDLRFCPPFCRCMLSTSTSLSENLWNVTNKILASPSLLVLLLWAVANRIKTAVQALKITGDLFFPVGGTSWEEEHLMWLKWNQRNINISIRISSTYPSWQNCQDQMRNTGAGM